MRSSGRIWLPRRANGHQAPQNREYHGTVGSRNASWFGPLQACWCPPQSSLARGADDGNTRQKSRAQRIKQMTTAAAKAFPAVPRDARDAAAQGFNFREGYFDVQDDFIDGSKMQRRGSMELSDGKGGKIVIPFQAKFTFGKPRAAN